jgi:hypothetical protein
MRPNLGVRNSGNSSATSDSNNGWAKWDKFGPVFTDVHMLSNSETDLRPIKDRLLVGSN